MSIHLEWFLREAVSLCKDAGILSIADEVFTGFGRTGEKDYCATSAEIDRIYELLAHVREL